MAKPAVFDSTAVLAVLFDEPGAGKIIDLLPGSLLSAINLAEIHSRLTAASHPPGLAWNRVLSMGFEVVSFTVEQARLAGEIPGTTGALTLAERACLALALERDATVYTTSRTWKTLSLDIDVMVVA